MYVVGYDDSEQPLWLEALPSLCLILSKAWQKHASYLEIFEGWWILSWHLFKQEAHPGDVHRFSDIDHIMIRVAWNTKPYPFDMIVPLASWMFSILHFTTVHPSYSFETQSRGKMFLKYLDLLNPAIGTMNEAPREDRARFSLNLRVCEFHWEVWSFKMISRWWGEIYNLIHVLIMD